MDSAAVVAFYDILKKILTLHSDISAYSLFLFPSIACDANIFPCIVPATTGDVQLFATTGDVQLFGFRQINPGFFPSYLRFRKSRGITTQNQGS